MDPASMAPGGGRGSEGHSGQREGLTQLGRRSSVSGSLPGGGNLQEAMVGVKQGRKKGAGGIERVGWVLEGTAPVKAQYPRKLLEGRETVAGSQRPFTEGHLWLRTPITSASGGQTRPQSGSAG